MDSDIAPPTAVSKATKRPKKAVTKDEDLFKDDTDIFADLPPSKPKEKKLKSKKAESKSIFKDGVGKNWNCGRELNLFRNISLNYG